MMSSCLSQNKKRQQHYLAFLQRERKTVQDLIALGYKWMRKAGLHPHFFGNNTLRDNARYLTFFALRLPPEYTNPHYLNLNLSEEDIRAVFAVFEKRIADRMPVEYISNEALYQGRVFYVNEHVLVPRSLMSTRFQDFMDNMNWSNKRILDLCTGSGCIGITLALMNPEVQVDLADISAEALKVAAANIEKYALENRVRCIQGDLFENIHERYDLIISNPPYVSSLEYRRGPMEFKKEPRLALESGADGLDLVKRILHQAKAHLTSPGKIIAEVGFPAAKRLKRLYPRFHWKWFSYRKPSGKKPFLAMDCIFECHAIDLPPEQPSRVGALMNRLLCWIP